MTRKERKLLRKYILIITSNIILWIGVIILALIKAGIYVL